MVVNWPNELKMRFSFVVLCFMTILVNDAFANERGVLPTLHGHNKPVVIEEIFPDDYDHDDCPRKYPLARKTSQQVPNAFKRYGVVPDLLDKPPTHILDVQYDNLDRCQPYLGNKVDICGILEQPGLQWKCSNAKKYTVLLIDINPYGVLNGNLGGFGILWFLVDVPGCRLSEGKSIFHYQAPTPLFGSGESPYAVLVYEQPEEEIDWSEEPEVMTTSFKYRFFKCVDELVRKYELKLVAGNFFYSEYDSCLIVYMDSIEKPYPRYLDRAMEAANLPEDPNTLDK